MDPEQWIDCSIFNSITGTTANVHHIFESVDTDEGSSNYGMVSLQGKKFNIEMTFMDQAEDIIVFEKKGNIREFARSKDSLKRGVIAVGTVEVINLATINAIKLTLQKLEKRAGKDKYVYVMADQNANGLLSAQLLKQRQIRLKCLSATLMLQRSTMLI